MAGDLYDQFHNNVRGTAPLNNAYDSLTKLTETYEGIRDNLQRALSNVRSSYSGSAAGAMSDAFVPLQKSFDDGANFSRGASLASYEQAGHFSVAQLKILKPVDVPGKPWYNGAVPWNTDYDDAVQKNAGIDTANEAAYNAYGSATQGAVGGVRPLDAGSSGFGHFGVDEGTQAQVHHDTTSTSSAPTHVGGGGQHTSYSGHTSNSSWQPPSTPNQPATHSSVPPLAAHSDPSSLPSGTTSAQGYAPPVQRPLPATWPGAGPNSGGVNVPGGGVGSGGVAGGFGPGGSAGMGGAGMARGGGSAGGSGGGLGGRGAGAAAGAESGAGGAGAPRTAGAGSAAAGERGASGRPGGAGGMGRGAGAGGKGGEDSEHKTASYLVSEGNGNAIVGDIDPVAPPVIG